MIIKNRETLLRVADLPHPEYTRWRDSHRELTGTDAWHEALGPYGGMDRLAFARTYSETSYCGMELVIALELYRRDHNEYPAALDVLAPQYIDAVPSDPFTGTPMVYQRAGNDYILYSVGRDQKDDGGDPRRTDDHVIHRPRSAEDE